MFAHVRGRSSSVCSNSKRNAVEDDYAPNLGTSVERVLIAFHFVRLENVIPFKVVHRDALNRVLFASTLDYGSVIFARVVVDDAARVAFLVLLPTKADISAYMRISFSFDSVATFFAFAHKNRIHVINVPVD